MGATASGKTALAIELAEALDLVVLSMDSRQVYQHMDVGTAKPTAAQRQRVRHELLDLRPPDQPINLQEFTALASEAIAAEHRRRSVAFLVGGTGLYLQALLAGLQPPAVPPQPALRAQFEALGHHPQRHRHRRRGGGRTGAPGVHSGFQRCLPTTWLYSVGSRLTFGVGTRPVKR